MCFTTDGGGGSFFTGAGAGAGAGAGTGAGAGALGLGSATGTVGVDDGRAGSCDVGDETSLCPGHPKPPRLATTARSATRMRTQS